MWYNIDDEIRKLKVRQQQLENQYDKYLQIIEAKIEVSKQYSINAVQEYEVQRSELLDQRLVDLLDYAQEINLLSQAKKILDKYALTGYDHDEY